MATDNPLREVRLAKLAQVRSEGGVGYPNRFRRTDFAGSLRERFAGASPETLQGLDDTFRLAGRVMTIRDFGKSFFLHLQDETGQLQLYFQRQTLGDERMAD